MPSVTTLSVDVSCLTLALIRYIHLLAALDNRHNPHIRACTFEVGGLYIGVDSFKLECLFDFRCAWDPLVLCVRYVLEGPIVMCSSIK